MFLIIMGFIQVDCGFVLNQYAFVIVSRPVVKRVLGEQCTQWAIAYQFFVEI